MIHIKKNVIRKYIVKLKRIFEVEFEATWQYVLKCYFRFQLKEELKGGRGLSLKMMCNKDLIQQFLDTDNSWNHLLCEKHNLRCPYWVEGKCKYKKCNKELRKKLKKSYN